MRRNYIRAFLVGALVTALTTASSISFTAKASSEPAPPAEEGAQSLFTSGTLSGTGGISINGNPAQAGATVLSGSTISTGADGNAAIDLGELGRITLGRGTTILLEFTADKILVKSQCQQISFKLLSGQAEIRSPDVSAVTVGKEYTLSGGLDLVAQSPADLSMECKPLYTGSYTYPGVGGLLALFGVATGITLGIISGSNGSDSDPPPVISPVVP